MKLNYWIAFFVLIVLLGIATRFAMGAEGDREIITVSWIPNSETDLAGYEIHYGRESGNYIFKVIMDTRTEYPLVVEQGITYYFAMKAFDTSGNVSAFSSEMSHTVPVIPAGDIDAPATPSATINIQPSTNKIILNLP